MLETLIRAGNGVAEAADHVSIAIGNDALIAKVVTYRDELAKRRRTLIANPALYDPEAAPEPWYTGPSEGDIFWPQLRATLEADSGWEAAVPALDAASTDIVGLLASPHNPVIRSRGLVLGHVQSGKTANFTATIAKAADAGYRLFIVLSGVHNALRRQTQLRLDQQLNTPHPTRWLQLTDETHDFGNPVKALPLVAGTNLRLLAVVKKNVSRLTRLRDWLREAHKHGGLDTCPVLIIDDESDQASVNSAKNAELDRTRINERIVELLGLPRVAYLGYTATPFANVLVNPKDSKDIYPRNFIYPLEKPKTYFGSRELFGAKLSEDEITPEAEGHDMIREVDTVEAAQHSPKSVAESGARVTDAMGQAITWFVLATAARRVRTGQRGHSSMLVHTTMRVDPQLGYLSPIRTFVRTLADRLAQGETEAVRTMWEAETLREPASRHGLSPVTFAELSEVVPEVLTELRVVADNSRATERLVYGDDPATVIAVGGNTLSRGLTLEGLVSSYFLRSSTAYDSLLQMGRWFGYRPGYSDLPRIWTTSQLARDFEFLADVEDSLRQEIERYSNLDGASPETLPVRIQMHPRLQATSRIKMQFAVQG
ncbi:MAG: Z1 domain-containing protein, partial [Cyclobacteriaceae bacterium]